MDLYIKYVNDRYIYLAPDDDCRAIVDFMLAADYGEEWCVGSDFEPEFVSRLMEAGFLVMSADAAEEGGPWYILLPKLHLVRSVLRFDDLHVKRSARRFLGRYELRPDAEFGRILDRCVEKHGGDWLTPPLVACIKEIRRSALASGRPSSPGAALLPAPGVYPAAFGLYRGDELAAGDFGVVCGGVYTSYSGFYDEPHAGTAQLILTARYLRGHGFAFWDFGMPMEYKTALGAADVRPGEFVGMFRAGAGLVG
ncbi:MAG: GNAT family N-acetyltransferase [Chitinispirillia bacterium]|nr:GNAT family N-acetyltransferase [Chitinispirillia bacterium]MCL2241137.1 GNAT family N-acetyltransferase [Chitinispirillia bacterium]